MASATLLDGALSLPYLRNLSTFSPDTSPSIDQNCKPEEDTAIELLAADLAVRFKEAVNILHELIDIDIDLDEYNNDID
jgi:hypothetical protein